jgi:hypothetical protein
MKSGKPAPLVGYNTNVRHSGNLFHIQTEDSGVDHPHIITHLFVEGTILATKKSSYAHLLKKEDWHEDVRQKMKDQHKAMFIELRDGVHDVMAEMIHGKADSPEVEALPRSEAPPKQSEAPTIDMDAPQAVRVIRPASMSPPKHQKPSEVPEVAVEPARGRSIFDAPDDKGEFGENLITNKSLDEVILSYLTDELED